MKTQISFTRVNVIHCVMVVMAVLILTGCSISADSDISVEPVYAAVTIDLTNHTFPPKSYLTKVNLFYNADELLYVKNRNDFRLKYMDPSIVMSDTGLSINFGLLPAGYFSSGRKITLYFLPLKEGVITIHGDLVCREKELILGPRNPAVIKKFIRTHVESSQFFRLLPLRADNFLRLAKQRALMYGVEYLKGKDIDLSVHDLPVDKVEDELEKLLTEEGFFLKSSARFDTGTCGVYIRTTGNGREIVEIRATIDRKASAIIDGNLHIYAFGNAPVDDVIGRIAGKYQERVSGK